MSDAQFFPAADTKAQSPRAPVVSPPGAPILNPDAQGIPSVSPIPIVTPIQRVHKVKPGQNAK